MLGRLNPVEIRILGSLIEKSLATPNSYPLSLYDVTSACNQKVSRDPVMTLKESEVNAGLASLMKKGLVWKREMAGRRTARFAYRGETLLADGTPPEWAVLCILMLRGPQTPGGIKDKGVRLYPFASVEEVETTLAALINRPDGPFVDRLPRQAKQIEERYDHRLAESRR